MLKRRDKKGDLWKPLLDKGADLEKILQKAFCIKNTQPKKTNSCLKDHL